MFSDMVHTGQLMLVANPQRLLRTLHFSVCRGWKKLIYGFFSSCYLNFPNSIILIVFVHQSKVYETTSKVGWKLDIIKYLQPSTFISFISSYVIFMYLSMYMYMKRRKTLHRKLWQCPCQPYKWLSSICDCFAGNIEAWLGFQYCSTTEKP